MQGRQWSWAWPCTSHILLGACILPAAGAPHVPPPCMQAAAPTVPSRQPACIHQFQQFHRPPAVCSPCSMSTSASGSPVNRMDRSSSSSWCSCSSGPSGRSRSGGRGGSGTPSGSKAGGGGGTAHGSSSGTPRGSRGGGGSSGTAHGSTRGAAGASAAPTAMLGGAGSGCSGSSGIRASRSFRGGRGGAAAQPSCCGASCAAWPAWAAAMAVGGVAGSAGPLAAAGNAWRAWLGSSAAREAGHRAGAALVASPAALPLCAGDGSLLPAAPLPLLADALGLPWCELAGSAFGRFLLGPSGCRSRPAWRGCGERWGSMRGVGRTVGSTCAVLIVQGRS